MLIKYFLLHGEVQDAKQYFSKAEGESIGFRPSFISFLTGTLQLIRKREFSGVDSSECDYLDAAKLCFAT